ncbi:MAG: hypothetical protein ACYTG0_39000 [Planctomycetota bacterium]|jgi:hypothetical protein
MTKHESPLLALGLAWILVATAGATAQAADAVELKVVNTPPPGELAEPIRDALSPSVTCLSEKGKPILELWLPKEIPLVSKTAAGQFAMTAANPGALLGAMKVYEERYDFKDEEIPPGVYVMRFGLQPEDGDHLGTSPTRTFALLVPAKTDRKVDAFSDPEELGEAASTVNAAEHPSNINLQPIKKPGKTFPRLASHNGGDHKVVCFRVPGKTVGEKGPAVAVTFALVYEGTGEL